MPNGTVWTFDTFTGYEGMYPVPDDLGGLCFITSVDGWEGAPAPRVQSDDRPSADGTNDGPSTQPGKTVTIIGTYRAPDVPRLQQAMARLSGALMRDTRYADLIGAEAWLTRRITVRRGAETIVVPSRTSLPEATFSFVLYGPGGIRTGDPVTTTTGLPATSGGLSIPFTIPFTISSNVVSGQCSATNVGTMTGPVKLRIDGPITGPQITHLGSGAQLTFASSLTLASGEWIEVDMDKHEVLANGQAPRNQWVTQRGWSGFDPGVNVWSFTAVAGTGLLTVIATPAWQ
jgi:hypothetical protein